MKKLIIKLSFLLFVSSLSAQNITWTDITAQFTLPEGIKAFKGERESPALKAWYLDIELKQQSIAIRPYLSTVSAGKEGVAPFNQRVGAIAAINGGYFDVTGSTSFSAVVYPGEVLAQNISTIYRNSVPYPVTRSFFGMTTDRDLSVDWIYHFGSQVEDIYIFDQPTQNSPGNPASIPTKSQGMTYAKLLVGIGGGPTLVKNGSVAISHDEEVFWDSGIGYSTANPRTAVGFISESHAILLVVDGRQVASQGVTLPDLAQIMVSLNCVAAMNLDGGGSTQMAIGNQLINRPEGGTSMRPVPTILAVVHADSLAFPKTIYFEKIIDTADEACSLVGLGWFPTANAGYWGTTASMLNSRGTGDKYALFRLGLKRPAQYELFAWWVAASNRCKDTPVIINHQDGCDTITVDQTSNGSKWNSLGSYFFNSDSSGQVIISNAAKTGTYIVADAIRIVSYDSSSITAVSGEITFQNRTNYILTNNYPNPFNCSTTIQFFLPRQSHVKIKIYNMLGEEVKNLLNEVKTNGNHQIIFDAEGLSSGIYFYQIEVESVKQIHKMLLIR
ncbi:T9SS C-terminal target domain-containing protein [candidate division KSB1 bacterium]|nr:MAG: T9SS C-terminal target domain-containing protein [candidate division KSB1 bacterium]